MDTIDIQAIIDARGLDVKEIAQQLFPTNQYARLALNRVMAGKAELDARQISKLAQLAGMSIGDLYVNGSWKTDQKDGVHTFTNDEYSASLDTNTWITKIFHKKSLLHESVICGPSISLSQYFESLNNIIANINPIKND